MKNGILILALGHSYYGKMAYNLLISIKCKWNIPVALVYDAAGVSHLTEDKLLMFDQRILCPYEFMHTDGVFDAHFAKVNLDKLTPFSKTLFLDADMVWNCHKNPEDLFKELEATDFTIANRGYGSDYSQWVNVSEIKEQFGINRYLDSSSEVIYFTKKAKDIFNKARKVHATKFTHRKINMCKPDEPCFSIALELLKKEPHQVPYVPSYWYYNNPRTNIKEAEIKSNYYVISAGGAFFDTQGNTMLKRTYENYTKYAFNIAQLEPFPLVQKNKVIPDRKSY